MADHHSQVTTNHDKIRRWVEERDGVPATVEDTSTRSSAAGVLRVKFPGEGAADELRPISWDDFFEKFDREHLAFLYQEEVEEGGVSRFCKFVDRSEQTKHA